MRAAQSHPPDHRTRAARTRRAGPARASGLAILAFCTLLAGCGQRGPLYYPILPPINASDTQMPAGLPMLQPLPAAQSPLMDGAPTTLIAAPVTSLPEAGESTMPSATRPAPAATPVLSPEQAAPLPSGAASGTGGSAGGSSSSSSAAPAAAGSSVQQ